MVNLAGQTAGWVEGSSMNSVEQWDADFRVLNAMRIYGGSFVKALATAALCADEQNRARIKAAFPEYWSKYTEMAKTLKEEA